MSRRFVWMPVGLMLITGGLGCQVPSYQLPAGYSSTYARHLQAEQYIAPWPMEPPPAGSIPEDSGVFYPQSFQYDPPTKSEFQQAVLVPEYRPERRRRN